MIPHRPQSTPATERLYAAVDAALQGWHHDEADRETPNNERLAALTRFFGEHVALAGLAFGGQYTNPRALADMLAHLIGAEAGRRIEDRRHV